MVAGSIAHNLQFICCTKPYPNHDAPSPTPLCLLMNHQNKACALQSRGSGSRSFISLWRVSGPSFCSVPTEHSKVKTKKQTNRVRVERNRVTKLRRKNVKDKNIETQRKQQRGQRYMHNIYYFIYCKYETFTIAI